MKNFCGIDFGTSNSSVGIEKDGEIQLIDLGKGKTYCPSAIFITDKEFLFGQEAVDAYLNGDEGRFMKSLKNILGSDLINHKFRLGHKSISLSYVLGKFLGYLKSCAEKEIGESIENVVIGRPVFFADENPLADKQAEEELKRQAEKVGFKNIKFQYEPVGAALSYKENFNKNEIMLIADIGGGTADFSILEIKDISGVVKKEVLGSGGIHIGGTLFDKNISMKSVAHNLGLGVVNKYDGIVSVGNTVFSNLSSWEKIRFCYNHQTKNDIAHAIKRSEAPFKLKRLLKILENELAHEVLIKIEDAKIKLSTEEKTKIDLTFLEKDFKIDFSRNDMNETLKKDIIKIVERAKKTVENKGLKIENISKLLLTGGSSKIPLFQKLLKEIFYKSDMLNIDSFGSVAHGLTIEAKKFFS